MHREVSVGIGGRENKGFLHLPPSFFLAKITEELVRR